MPRILDWFGAGSRPQDVQLALMRAQHAAFSRQVPLLYLILAVDAIACAYTFAGKAPWSLSALAPALLVAGCAVRIAIWLHRRRQAPDDSTLRRRLIAMTGMTFLFAVLFVVWVIALYDYGDAAMRGQLVGAFGVTTIICIYCLMQFPQTALLLAAVCVPTVSVFLMRSGSEPMMAFAAALCAVTFGLVYMTMRTARDFADMIEAQVETQRLNEQNDRLAHIDSLTGLPNRRRFFEALDAAVAARRDDERIYVGLLDLDGFKPVNDVFGHVVGDRVLVECGARFSAAVRGKAFVARLGGDEFGLILEGARSETDAIALAERICETTREPFAFDDAIATISTTIGLAACPDSGEAPAHLYERADFALYFAKQHNRGRPLLFNAEHERRMKGAAHVEQSLRRADLDAEMDLVFQPLHDAETGEIVSFEALARWNSPDLGQIAPDRFVPIAERSDIIYPLTRALLRKALTAASAWPSDIQLSFNLSARDLMSPAAVAQIVAIVESGPIAAKRVDFEITETALVTDFDRARAAIVALKSTGASMSLDDFGTGYSSLNYVHRLPLDRIKIDRSFVREMEGSAVARDIVKTMIAMARNLQFDCVIEGVETREQLALLKSFGCNMAQGYLFSRPLSRDEAAAFIYARRALAPSTSRRLA